MIMFRPRRLSMLNPIQYNYLHLQRRERFLGDCSDGQDPPCMTEVVPAEAPTAHVAHRQLKEDIMSIEARIPGQVSFKCHVAAWTIYISIIGPYSRSHR